MNQNKIRLLMVIYSIIFLFLSVSFVINDIKNEYHFLYIVWSIIIYLLANFGNIFYSLRKSNNVIKKY